MKVVVAILVRDPRGVELSRWPMAGRPWIVRMVERLRAARSVSQVVVMCSERRDEIAALFESTTAEILATDDPLRTACELPDYDGIAFCPVEQFFADPGRLDALAAIEAPPGVATLSAVLSGDPSLALSGGAFLRILTREGIRAVAAGQDLAKMPAAVLATEPEPPELRLREHEDFRWATVAAGALLARDPSGSLAEIEQVLTDAGLGRFGFWNVVGRPVRAILTIRCLPLPLFAHLVRHLGRLGAPAIDVVCAASLAAETRALRGVREVLPFDAPAFNLDALGAETLTRIRARAYDLCVVPRREPTGRGFENLTPLGAVSGARTAIWLDIFGASGLLAQPQDQENEAQLPPHEEAWEYLCRAVRALEHFAPGSEGSPFRPVDPSVGGLRRSFATRTGEAPRADPLEPLLKKLDENLSCRALTDNLDLAIDLSTVLLFQLPASAEIQRRITQLESTEHRWVAPLTAAADALFRHLVELQASHAAGATNGSPSPHAIDLVERFAAALGSLADDARQHAPMSVAGGT